MRVLGSWYYNGFKSLIAVKLRLHTAINRVDFLRKKHCAFEGKPLNHIHHDTKYARLIAVSKRTLRDFMDRASTDGKLKPTPPIWKRAFEVYMRLASQRGKASLCFFRWKSYEANIWNLLKLRLLTWSVRNVPRPKVSVNVECVFWVLTVK